MNKSINKFSAQSLDVWRDVKHDIEMKIISGAFAAGERIPSTRRIAEYYSVGLSTVQKVLNALESDGIIEPQRGIGYFVKPYIREKLIASKKQALEIAIVNALSEAEILNVDLVAIVEKYKKMKRV